MRLITALVALTLVAAGLARAAEEWGIEYESKARLEAKVVDILCERTGDCPADCGAGKRQLGLLKDDGILVPAIKNFDPFAGVVNDLVSFCGKRVVADGLMIDDPQMPVFALQFKRLAPEGKWSRTDWFGKDWAHNHHLEPGEAMATNGSATKKLSRR
jgi:hypothetical protein